MTSSLKDTPPFSPGCSSLVCYQNLRSIFGCRLWQFLGADFDKLGRFTWLCMVKSVVFTHYSKDGGFSIWNGVLWIFQNNTVVWIYTHTPNRLKVPSPPWKKVFYKFFLSEKSAFLRPSWEKKYQYHSDINCLGTNFLWVYPVMDYFLELHFLELHFNVGVDIPWNPRIMDGKTG